MCQCMSVSLAICFSLGLPVSVLGWRLFAAEAVLAWVLMVTNDVTGETVSAAGVSFISRTHRLSQAARFELHFKVALV